MRRVRTPSVARSAERPKLTPVPVQGVPPEVLEAGTRRLQDLLDRLAAAEGRLTVAEAEIEHLKELHLAVAHCALKRDPRERFHA